MILSSIAGADIEVNEDGSSTAPLAVSLCTSSPAGSDWCNDRRRVSDALADCRGGAWTTDQFREQTDVHYRADGAHIHTEYAPHTGRLVYATIQRPGEDSFRVLGAAKVEYVLGAIADLDQGSGLHRLGVPTRSDWRP